MMPLDFIQSISTKLHKVVETVGLTIHIPSGTPTQEPPHRSAVLRPDPTIRGGYSHYLLSMVKVFLTSPRAQASRGVLRDATYHTSVEFVLIRGWGAQAV